MISWGLRRPDCIFPADPDPLRDIRQAIRGIGPVPGRRGISGGLGNTGQHSRIRDFHFRFIILLFDPDIQHPVMMEENTFQLNALRIPATGSVIKLLIRMFHSEYFDGLLLANDSKFLRDSIDSFEWRNPKEQAIAYSVLSDIYSKGIPNLVNADVKYAYSCIQKCAEIDPDLAKDEIKRYSKNIFGMVTYK